MSKNKNNKSSKSSESDESKNKTDISVFLTVFWYCLFIIGSPVITFFVSKIAFDSLNFTSTNSNIYAAISAVVSLHIALGFYLFKAYSEDKPKSSQGKQD